MIFLSRQDVESILDMQTCIDCVRTAFRVVSEDKVQSPPRTVIRLADRTGFFGSMPVYASGYGSAAKVMTIYPENHDAGLASHQGFILLFAEDAGEPLALIEAGSITELRTAAVSGLATELMSNPDARSLCVLGSGVQARSHVTAMTCVRTVEHIRIWSRTRSHADSFANWVRERWHGELTVHDSPSEALSGADLVCTVTAARDPIVQAEDVSPGCHINAVGSFTPSARELDSETVRRSVLVVDSRESALRESGDVMTPIEEGTISENHIVAELSDVVIGNPVRTDPEQITVFKSLGLAIEDLAASKAAYDLAMSRQAGTSIPY